MMDLSLSKGLPAPPLLNTRLGIFTPQDFINTWKFELAHDFEKDGVPATWAPGQSGPKKWGSEDKKVELPGHPGALALSADGTSLAVAIKSEIIIYDVATLAVRKKQRHAGKIDEVAFHPSGRFLLSSSNVLSGPGRQMQAFLQLSDLDAEVGTGDWDTFTSKILDVSTEALVSERSWSADEVEAMSRALKASLEELFSAAEVQRDVKRGDILEGRLASFGSRHFTHDGKFLLYLGERTEVVVYNVIERKEHFRLQGHADAIMWIGSNPDDTILATSSWDGTVKLWQADTGALLHTLETERHQLWAARFSPDGRFLAVGSGSGNIYVWRVETVETVELVNTLKGGPGWVRTLDFSMGPEQDAVYLAAGAASNVRVFNIHTTEQIQHWEVKSRASGMRFEVQYVQYSPSEFAPHVLGIKTPDGRITISDSERNVKWEFEQPLTDAPRLYGAGYMVFSTATMSIISADQDNALRVWNL